MNDVFENAVSSIRTMASALEAEVGRMQGLAAAKQAEDHLLEVARKNRADTERQTEAVKAEFLGARRDLEAANAEAARVVCEAEKTAAELVANARDEASQLVAAARKKIANAHSQLEIAS